CMCLFFNDTATTEIYTLSLHDALPISHTPTHMRGHTHTHTHTQWHSASFLRSEEHTSELQSHLNLVCRPLPEKTQHYSDRSRRQPPYATTPAPHSARADT